MDQIILRASAAFGQGRVVQMLLDDTILPVLDPAQRTFAQNLSRRIARDRILDETFLCDLDAFVAFIEKLIADGTVVGWETDEHHSDGGHEIAHLNARAKALSPVVSESRKLWFAIAQTLDALKATAVVLKLVSE